MNTVKDLESAALKEKILQVLRNDNLRKIIELTEYLMSDSEKIGVVMERINKILEDKVIHKRVYYPTEWAAAYVIAHEYDTLKRLVEINENSFIKQKYSQLLANKIRDAIYNLHNLIDELVKEIKKTNDDNTYDIILDKIVQTDSVIKYLVSFLDKVDKEYKEAREAISTSEADIKKTILGIIEKL